MLDKLYIHTCGNPFLTIIEILKAGHVKKGSLLELTVCVWGAHKLGICPGPLTLEHTIAPEPWQECLCQGAPTQLEGKTEMRWGVTSRPPTEPNLLNPPVLTENQVLCTRTLAHLRHSCIIAVQDGKGALRVRPLPVCALLRTTLCLCP